MDTFATGEEAKSPTYYRVAWAIAVGVVTAALLFINESGIQAIQEVVTIVALPFFIMQGFIMVSLLKGMGDDFAAEKRVRTRRWGSRIPPKNWKGPKTNLLQATTKTATKSKPRNSNTKKATAGN